VLFVDLANKDYRNAPGSPAIGFMPDGSNAGPYQTGHEVIGLLPNWPLYAEELLGDFDNDQDVDGADFLAWQRDMTVGSLSDWETYFGTAAATIAAVGVPEPTSAALSILAAISLLAGRRRPCRSR